MKRLTDCDKWIKNKWFRKLSVEYKLLWLYLLDMCDNVGVWEEDIEIASMAIGYKYSIDTVLKVFGTRIKLIKDNRKWWIVDFISFQYGELSEDTSSKPHKSYIRDLKKHGLWIGYVNTIQRHKDKDKEEDRDKY